MAELSAIEWTDHTQNFWEGCQSASPGCDLCYAEARNKRFGGGVASNWGPGAPRRRMSVTTRVNPHRWNKAHEAFYAVHGRRQRVFCASLSDWLDNAIPIEWFIELLDTVRLTPNLDWQLLTKRIGNWRKRMREALDDLDTQPVPNVALIIWVREWLNGNAPANVWVGATIVNQEEADRDIPKLLATPAAVRFLSMEPLLGPVDIGKYVAPWTCSNCQHWGSEADSGPCKCADCDIESVYDESIGSDRCPQCGKDNGTSEVVAKSCPSCERSGGWQTDDGFRFDAEKPSLLDWIIAGGESGPGARPSHPDWYRSLRDQCAAAGVPFLFKQWGSWTLHEVGADWTVEPGMPMDWKGLRHWDRGAWEEPAGDTPAGLIFKPGAVLAMPANKKAAGRLLDGIEHNGFPNA